MKVLFVCNGNVGRSPMAEAFFNKLSKKGSASSAGVIVAAEGNVGKPTNIMNITVMNEMGCDLSRHKRRQLTEAMVKASDIVVFMGTQSKMPGYLRKSKKVKLWRIRDPKRQSMAVRRLIRNKIKTKVQNLIGWIG